MKATLTFIINDNKILLAQKKKKIGAGKWNGYGGKPEPSDTTIRDTACRELYEESGKGIVVALEDLVPCAVIDFFFFSNDSLVPDWSVIVYIAKIFSGTASETDEAGEPRWFPFDQIPYAEMMPGDELFLSKMLKGESFFGTIRFNEEKTAVIGSSFEPMDPGLLEI